MNDHLMDTRRTACIRRARKMMMRLAMRAASGCVVLALLAMPAWTAPAHGQEYAAMEGVVSAATVFDFRVGDPEVALGHLRLIHSMLDDPAMRAGGGRPDIVVVFVGPSVNLVSTDGGAADPGTRAAIAEKIAAMDADGVRFEICMTAAHAHGVAADSILPWVVQVGNGWISLIGYQHRGYALIADF